MFKRLRSKTNEEIGPAPTPRQPNKLSKPRTNKHIPTTPSKQTEKRRSRQQLSPHIGDDPESNNGSVPSLADRYELRRQAHSQIWGSSRDILTAREEGPVHDEGQDDLTASVNSQRALKSRTLANAKLNGYISTSQVSLVTEQPLNTPTSPMKSFRFSKSSSPEERSGLRESTSYADLLESSNPEDDADEATEAMSASMTRRRSLATPGIATRQPRAGDLSPLRSHPLYEEDLEVGEAWTQGVSPLPSPRGFLSAVPHTDEARAQTPNEMDYGRIGAAQTGGLVITNGRASPEPSIASTSRQITLGCSVPNFHREDDYYTASEGDHTPVTATPTAVSYDDLSGQQRRQEDALVPAIPPRSTERATDLPKHEKYRFEERSSSPLKHEFIAPQASMASLSTRSAEREPPRVFLTEPSLTRSASHFARGYMMELQDNSYEPQLARAVSVKRVVPIRAISGQSAQSVSVYSVGTDEGFAEAAPVELPIKQEDADDELERSTLDSIEADLDDILNDEVSRQQINEDASVQLTPPKTARPKQSMADSGYSSGASLQDTATPADERGDSTDEERTSLDDFDLIIPKKRLSGASDSMSLYTFDQMLGKLPPVAAHYMEPSKPRVTTTTKPTRMSLLRSVSWGKAKSEAAFASTTSVPTIASVKSDMTTKSSSSTATTKPSKERKKLRKARPRARTAVTMSGLRPLTGDDVPRVPSQMRMQHTNRMNDNPENSHIERTFAAIEGHTDEQEDESQIETSFEIRFPSPTPEAADEEYDEMAIKKKRRSWRMSTKAREQSSHDRPPTPPQHRNGVGGFFERVSRSGSVERRSRQSFQEEGAVIADFATAAVSLGSSPYDIATETGRGRSRPKFNTNSTGVIHPHQISTSTSRPRSWVEMDDATASEFAKEKSRRRAEMVNNWSEETGGMVPPMKRRPGIAPRPNSFHEGMARPVARTPSTGSVRSMERSNSFSERSAPPTRAPSNGSERERGRPQGFHEWELNRRSSRSRSRPRLPLDGSTPPVPPLPAQTLEREEEYQYDDMPAKQVTPDAGTLSVQEKRSSWHRPSNSDCAPEVTTSSPVQQHHPADWSVSSDIWKQRRMLLSQNLQVQTARSTKTSTHNNQSDSLTSPVSPVAQTNAAPLPPPQIVLVRATPTPTQGLYEIDGTERERLELDSHEVPRQELFAASPSPPPHARPSIVRAPTAPPTPVDPRRSVDSARRRPTPFDRIATSPLARPASSSSLSSRAAPAKAVQPPTRASAGVYNRAVYDRYSGGLGFEGGFGGSAGTRALKSSGPGAPRRSVQLSQSHGVDMSDVPVFFPHRVG